MAGAKQRNPGVRSIGRGEAGTLLSAPEPNARTTGTIAPELV